MQTIATLFREAVNDAGDAPFLTLADGTSISYADAWARTTALAARFRALGVKDGDRIAIHAEKSPDALFVYLAAQRVGAVFLPLNTAYTADELEYFLADATPALFICRPQDETALAALCSRIGLPCCKSLGTAGDGTLCDGLNAAAPEDFTDASRGPDDLAAILYTSGTTGRSKGAMLTNANLVSNGLTLRDYWRFTREDVLLHALPIFHTHGLFVATNTILAARATMIFLPKLDVPSMLDLMAQATTMMGVPTFYTRLLDDPRFTRDVAAHMRLFISGSAPLSADVHREFSERTGHAILERYGMTETNMITSNPYDGARVPGSVGFPLPGVSVRIADPETGAELPQGEIGGIEVKGPNVFVGYWQMPEKTKQEFRADGFFITGDLGRVDENGYVHIVGRSKDLIISGGFNVYPAEVEALLDELPGIAESAVIAVPHRDFGEAVVAVVQGRDSSLTEEAIIAAIADKLARFKQPKRVFFVSELPRNAMGKIQKAQLREQFAATFA
ncbi:malonyl-CoA synthase [Sphingobium sp. MK2]|uniref:malonate--CoA ligase n=1 Tax=Sphingobium sp. MK2 TaxID=3116540 RepID=UPI0032E367CA